MRRVSSRQRLVSWDAFDATARGVDEESLDEVSFATCRTSSSASLLPECSNEDSTLKRKRPMCKERKQEPPTACTATVTLTVTASVTIPAFDWELPPSPTASAVSALSGLNDDLQLQILEFCDTSSLRSMMQINRRFRNLMASPDARVLWTAVCHRQWPWLDEPPASNNTTTTTDLVDTLDLPTAAVTPDQDSTKIPNHALLLSLAAQHSATTIDESAFLPQRHPNLRRLRARTRQPEHSMTSTTATAELKRLQVTASGETTAAVQFTGPVGRGDRCIRGDEPLPRPALLKTPEPDTTETLGARHLSLLQRLAQFHNTQRSPPDPALTKPTWRPFVAPFTASTSSSSSSHHVHNVTPRLVSYFEVSVLGKTDASSTPTPTTTTDGAPTDHFDFQAQLTRNNNNNAVTAAPECVAIGIATDDFSWHSRMPGWDRFSYGYHGDDGGIFHSHGNMLREYGPRYGVGDTVGCGVDYHRRAIFFTKNGQFLGYAFTDISMQELQLDFFPVVGMDTNCPVVCNFGKKPFVFDLNAMIHQQRSVIVRSIGGSSSTAASSLVLSS